MIALGNDVVDLSVTPKNGERYYQRLIKVAFHTDELEQIPQGYPLNVLCGVLWSAKEAAYKSFKKLKKTNEFRPKELRIERLKKTESGYVGQVHGYGFSLWLEVIVHQNLVHSHTYLNGSCSPQIGISMSEDTYSEQSRIVREEAIHSFGSANEVVKNNEGIPWFALNGQILPNELSLSHHGQFVAFVYEQ